MPSSVCIKKSWYFYQNIIFVKNANLSSVAGLFSHYLINCSHKFFFLFYLFQPDFFISNSIRKQIFSIIIFLQFEELPEVKVQTDNYVLNIFIQLLNAISLIHKLDIRKWQITWIRNEKNCPRKFDVVITTDNYQLNGEKQKFISWHYSLIMKFSI